MEEVSSRGHDRIVFVGRLITGLIQGVALYLLYSAFEDKLWPATNGFIFAPSVIVALFVPLLVVQAMGNARWLTLAIWTVLASALVAGLAWYDIWHGWPTEHTWLVGRYGDAPRLLPAFATFFFSAVFLFIAQALIVASDNDRRFLAHYPTHFDVAWKQGLQYVLAHCFVALFWVLLWLGAELFKLINLDFLQKLIEHRWFAIPATTLAIAAAIHITDVRATLVRGARSLVLALFSWLLPLIALIAAGFLASLFVTGLDPLWKTRMGTSLLLVAAGWLIVLINAAYQDGDEARRPVALLRFACKLGGLLLAPMVVLAGYAVYLRIMQYGWTADRISAVACVTVAGAYAIGYAIAALWPKPWFKPAERWNFFVALLILAVIGALFSPVADPMRISVKSQVARLESGRISPDKFDYWYLRWSGGRYGKAELERLRKSRDIRIANGAKSALENSNPWERHVPPPPPPTPQELAKNFTMHPAGSKLPDSFLNQSWTDDSLVWAVRECFARGKRVGRNCDAVLKNDAGVQEVWLIASERESNGWWHLAIFTQIGGKWAVIGTRFSPVGHACKGEREAILAGKFMTDVPIQRDIIIGSRRLVVTPGGSDSPCPK